MPRRRSVFKNRDSLFPRHIPTVLPHREYQIRMLHDLFTDFLEKPKESYQRIVQVLGPIGSGKSCTAYRFGIELEREAKARKILLRVVHVSCKLGVDSRYALYQNVLQKLKAEKQFSTLDKPFINTIPIHKPAPPQKKKKILINPQSINSN